MADRKSCIAKTIRDYLEAIKMDRYIENFIDFGYTELYQIQNITDDDLVNIGVPLVGHRNKIIKGLRGERELLLPLPVDVWWCELYLGTSLVWWPMMVLSFSMVPCLVKPRLVCEMAHQSSVCVHSSFMMVLLWLVVKCTVELFWCTIGYKVICHRTCSNPITFRECV